MKNLLFLFISLIVLGTQARQIRIYPGQDIQLAVDKAIEGDTVLLGPGPWEINQQVNLRSGVSVVGSGIGTTILNTRMGAGVSNSPINRGLAVFRALGKNNIKLGGFTIQGGTSVNNRVGYAGIVIQGCSNIDVFEVEIKYTAAFAIIFDGVKHSFFRESITTDSGSFASSWSWGAVMLWNLEDFVYIRNVHNETQSYCVKSQSTLLKNVSFVGNVFHTLGTLSPWGSSGSENIAAEFHGVYHDRVRFSGNHFDNQLSIASNHRAEWSHSLHIYRNIWEAPANRAHKPDYNIELNIYSTLKDVLVYENYGNCRTRFIGTWLQGAKVGGWKIYNNVADNMRTGGRYSGFIVGNSVLADIDIYNNTIFHPYDEEWSLIYLDSKAQNVSTGINIYNNIIRLNNYAGSYILRHDRNGGFRDVRFDGNIIDGFRQDGKFKGGGVAPGSDNNIYTSARLRLSGDKPFPFYSTEYEDKGAQDWPTNGIPDEPTFPTDTTPNPYPEPEVNEILPDGEIVIDAGGPGDQYFIGGNSYSVAGYNERWGNFSYRIPVDQSDSIKIILDLTEIYWREQGRREFDVYINRILVLDNFDPYGVSGLNRILYTITVPNDSSLLDIRFIGEVDNAKVNSIAVSYVNDSTMNDCPECPECPTPEPCPEVDKLKQWIRENLEIHFNDSTFKIIIPNPDDYNGEEPQYMKNKREAINGLKN